MESSLKVSVPVSFSPDLMIGGRFFSCPSSVTSSTLFTDSYFLLETDPGAVFDDEETLRLSSFCVAFADFFRSDFAVTFFILAL